MDDKVGVDMTNRVPPDISDSESTSIHTQSEQCSCCISRIQVNKNVFDMRVSGSLHLLGLPSM